MIIEDRMSIGGKSLREVYEVENHNKAFQYIKDNINNSLDPFMELVINLEEEQLDTYINLIEQILENNLNDNMEP